MLTTIPADAFHIKTDVEFFLFMEMRCAQQWVSFQIQPRTWILITREYNQALRVRNAVLGLPTTDKNPRAMMEKLGEIETAIMKRLSTKNFKCEFILEVIRR